MLEEDETFDDLAIEIEILKLCSHKRVVKLFGAWKKGEELFVCLARIWPSSSSPSTLT
jgi:hypothetical protein